MNFLSIVWDPSLGIDLGFYVIRWYSIMFVLAFILGTRFMKKMFINDAIPIEKLDALFMYTFVSMLIGMRLGDVFFYSWDYYQHHLLLGYRIRITTCGPQRLVNNFPTQKSTLACHQY